MPDQEGTAQMASSELAVREDSAITVLPPQQAAMHSARVALREHAEMMSDAYQLAKGVCGDGRNGTGQLVPQRFRGKPEEGAAAILYGAELGLNPMQSLQRVIPIHGMPSIEARTMVALLKARGYRIRTIAQSNESVTVQGIDLDGEVYTSTWTMERAVLAGYVPTPASDTSLRRPTVDEDWVTVSKTWDGKVKKSVVGNMKYITDPQTMLRAKAQAEICREMAPDVLMGISYTSEELESEGFQEDASPAQGRGGAKRSSGQEPLTVDEIMNPESARPTREEPIPVDAEADAESDAERYALENLTGEDAIAYLAGERAPREGEPDNGYVAPASATEQASEPEPVAEAQPDPAPAAEVAPTPAAAAAEKPKAEKAKPTKTAMRKALERRLFKLLGDAKLSAEEDREDRLTVYRHILGRPDVTSTDDLSDTDATAVADALYAWSEKGELDQKVTDILNTATLAQDQQ